MPYEYNGHDVRVRCGLGVFRTLRHLSRNEVPILVNKVPVSFLYWETVCQVWQIITDGFGKSIEVSSFSDRDFLVLRLCDGVSVTIQALQEWSIDLRHLRRLNNIRR